MFFNHRLVLITIACSGVISACSTTAQNSNPMNHHQMNHDTMMNHSMMDLGPADSNYDLRFIDSMIPHHQGAVIMAKDLLSKSKRPEMKQLATEIIAAQDREIAQMKQWRKSWYPQAEETAMAWHSSMNHMMPMSSEQMKAMRMDMDLGAADSNYDLRFINAMIPHHQAAVVMAKDLLQKSKRPEMQQLAKNIITSQQAEIEKMKQWRKAWYGKEKSN